VQKSDFTGRLVQARPSILEALHEVSFGNNEVCQSLVVWSTEGVDLEERLFVGGLIFWGGGGLSEGVEGVEMFLDKGGGVQIRCIFLLMMQVHTQAWVPVCGDWSRENGGTWKVSQASVFPCGAALPCPRCGGCYGQWGCLWGGGVFNMLRCNVLFMLPATWAQGHEEDWR